MKLIEYLNFTTIILDYFFRLADIVPTVDKPTPTSNNELKISILKPLTNKSNNDINIAVHRHKAILNFLLEYLLSDPDKLSFRIVLISFIF